MVAEPWSDEALIEFPESGGLINRARDIVFNRAQKAVREAHERWAKDREALRRKRAKKGGSK